MGMLVGDSDQRKRRNAEGDNKIKGNILGSSWYRFVQVMHPRSSVDSQRTTDHSLRLDSVNGNERTHSVREAGASRGR